MACLALRFAFLAVLAVFPALASLIVVDEHGDLVIDLVASQGFVGRDSGPGGATNALIYILPFLGVQGDVIMTDAGIRMDVLRFNGDGTLIFYSDNFDGADALGDRSGLPGSAYTNLVSIQEFGGELSAEGFYTPTAGQPGFNASFNPMYDFISEGSFVPEPSSLVLMVAGLGALSLLRIRRRSRA